MVIESKPNVGARLRMFRERQGWSLRALADRCGLSINAISRIERGENSPTVTSLHRLSTALAVPITDFFLERPQTTAILVRSGLGVASRSDGYIAEQLGIGLQGQQLEPFLLRIDSGCRSAANPISHPGEEFVLCLTGLIEYCINNQTYPLSSGDSLLFDAMQPHYWSNETPDPATLLLVFQAAQDNSLARLKHNTG